MYSVLPPALTNAAYTASLSAVVQTVWQRFVAQNGSTVYQASGALSAYNEIGRFFNFPSFPTVNSWMTRAQSTVSAHTHPVRITCRSLMIQVPRSRAMMLWPLQKRKERPRLHVPGLVCIQERTWRICIQSGTRTPSMPVHSAPISTQRMSLWNSLQPDLLASFANLRFGRETR